MRPVSSLPLFAAAAAAQATAGPYGQCGGIGYSGPSACGSGYGCTTYNPYYAQCYPGVANTPTTSSSSTRRTSSAITIDSSPGIPVSRTSTTGIIYDSSPGIPPTPSPSSTRTTIIIDSSPGIPPSSTRRTSNPGIIYDSSPGIPPTHTPTTTTAGSGSTATPTTLESGWYWIRAVASPYFHSYLQAAPTPTATSTPNALISKASNAGQFNIVSGQLVWHRFGGQPPLYMHVENPADKTQRKLRTWFESSQNTYGTFAFQGDTVTWSVSDINRPNTAAWLVCGGDELFVNTGAFLYQTPEGCFDHTIHSYGGSTADV